jgi:hypothetical protein
LSLRYNRNALVENKQFPTSYNLIHGSLSSGALSDLQSSNDVHMVFSAGLVGGNQRIVEAEFAGSHSGHMPFLQLLAELKTSVAVGCELSAYNYEQGAYETTAPMYLWFGTLTYDQTKYLYNTLNSRKYRSTLGEWKVKVKTTRTGTGDPGAYTLSIDHLYYRTVAYELKTANTTTVAGAEQNVMGSTVGIRVWKVNSDDSETEIDGSDLKAAVTGPSRTQTLNANYTPPQTSNVVALLVRVYVGSDTLSTTALSLGGLPMVFITEDVNDTLQSTQWTVYYAFYYNATFDETYYRFGSSTFQSRINSVNFGSGSPYFPNRQTLRTFPSTTICVNG